MPQSSEHPANEYSSTYFVHDRRSLKELTRVKIQDHLVTAAMGGVLPEQPDPSIFQRVLDIGCGTGGWAIDAAQAYPNMSLVGIDVSKPMIEYARAQTETLQLAQRVKFHVMDALLILEFPPDYFDLVNIRFGASFMRIWDWPKLFSEMLRVSRSGGVIRVTEPENFNQCTSPAHIRFNEMIQCALFHAGHLFESTPTGITLHLADLFTRHDVQGCRHVPMPWSFRPEPLKVNPILKMWSICFIPFAPLFRDGAALLKTTMLSTPNFLRNYDSPHIIAPGNSSLPGGLSRLPVKLCVEAMLASTIHTQPN